MVAVARYLYATDECIWAPGFQITVLRSSLWADDIPGLVGQDEGIRVQAGAGMMALVARTDIAHAAAAFLRESTRHEITTCGLKRPEALSMETSAGEHSPVGPGRFATFHRR